MTNAVLQRDKTQTLREKTNLPPRPSAAGTVGPWATEAGAAASAGFPSPPLDDFRFPRGDVSELADDDGSAVIEAYLGEKIEVRSLCLLSRSHCVPRAQTVVTGQHGQHTNTRMVSDLAVSVASPSSAFVASVRCWSVMAGFSPRLSALRSLHKTD